MICRFSHLAIEDNEHSIMGQNLQMPLSHTQINKKNLVELQERNILLKQNLVGVYWTKWSRVF